MNRLNLRRLGALGSGLHDNAGSSSFALVGVSRKAFGFARPPRWTESDQFTGETASHQDPTAREFTEPHAAYLHAGRAMAALLRLDHAVATVGSDRSLSAIGQREKLRAARAGAARTMALQAGAVRAIRGTQDAAFTAFYAPTLIAKDDLPALFADRELRDHWRSISDSQRTQLAAAMAGTGAHDRMALALLRGPIPLTEPFADLVTRGWRAAVAKREPAKAAQIATEAADVEWSEHVLDATRQYLAPLLEPELRERDCRPEFYKAIRDVAGAAEMIGFPAHEMAQYEQRIAAAG